MYVCVYIQHINIAIVFPVEKEKKRKAHVVMS
jgi:hypothetical protein